MTHTAKTPPPSQAARASVFATLRNLNPAGGSSASAPRRAPLLIALLAICALACALAPAAQADSGFGEQGTGAGQISPLPKGVAVSRQSGDVYVVDQGNRRIDQFQADGTFIRAFGWKVDAAAPEEKLQECTVLSGCQQGTEGAGAGQFAFARGIAVDNVESSSSYGDLYVTDKNNNRVEKFDPAGHFLLTFGKQVNKTALAESVTRSAEENVCPAPGHPADTCGAGLSGSGAGQFEQTQSSTFPIAVGPAGVVYVGDGASRVQEFAPDGTFLAQHSLSDPIVASELAVDQATGDVYVHQDNQNEVSHQEVAGIQKYGPSFGAPLETLDAAGKPEHFALTEAGDLIVGQKAGEEYEFQAYNPAGALFAVFGSEQILGGSVQGIAVGDAAAKLYAVNHSRIINSAFEPEEATHVVAVPLPEPGPPVIQAGSEEATQIEPETATLNAVANAEGHAAEVHFEYITQQKFVEDGNSFGAGTETTAPPVDIGLLIHDHPVSAGISGLHTETAYRFRAVITSHCNEAEPLEVCEAKGPGAALTTLPPVSIRDFTTQTVGPETVVLKAELSPDNGTGTHYTICYGADETHALACSEGEVHVLGNDFEPLTASFEHLEPDTGYHYWLTAINSYGEEVKSTDQVLTTEPSAAEERAAEDCPANGTVHGEVRSTLREQNDSLALPDCRAYEQVSPVEKAGYAVNATGFGGLDLAPSGERAEFGSTGAFAGAVASHSLVKYLAQRSAASGWQTRAAIGSPGPEAQPFGPSQFTPELDTSLFVVRTAPNWFRGTYDSTSGSLYLDIAGSLLPATPTLERLDGKPIGIGGSSLLVSGQSADLSHLVLATSYALLANDPRPEVGEVRDRLYEVSGAAGPSPGMALLAEVPLGLTSETCQVDSAISQPVNLVSAGGSTIFYTLPLDEHSGQQCDNSGTSTFPNKSAIFARTGVAAAVQIAPPPAPYPAWCHSPAPCFTAANQTARFYGASPDGSRVWFTTTQPLIDADTDAGNDLYTARLENGQVTELVQVSGGDNTDPHPGAGAGLQGVVQVSSDGNRAYFIATGVLTTAENALHQSAQQGAENLYFYDAQSGETKFVARLCSDAAKSGSQADPACGANVSSEHAKNDMNLAGTGEDREAQLTPDGRYLLFSSFARLVPGDTDNARDVYRYDSQTGQIIRLSFGRNGNDGGGNDDAYGAVVTPPKWSIEGGNAEDLAGDSVRAISDAGSSVIFTTAAPLVSADTNTGADPGCRGGPGETGCDVYEWEQQGHGTCQADEAGSGGCIRLLSDGLDHNGTHLAVLSSSGRDVAFITARSLVPSDTDGEADVYDARENGGFPAPPIPPICAGNETCHGPVPPVPAAPKITTPEFVGPGNSKERPTCAKGKVRVKKHGQVRCVAKKHHKAKNHHKRANTNRGGGK